MGYFFGDTFTYLGREVSEMWGRSFVCSAKFMRCGSCELVRPWERGFLLFRRKLEREIYLIVFSVFILFLLNYNFKLNFYF